MYCSEHKKEVYTSHVIPCSFIINYRHILLNRPQVIFSLDKLIIFWTQKKNLKVPMNSHPCKCLARQLQRQSIFPIAFGTVNGYNAIQVAFMRFWSISLCSVSLTDYIFSCCEIWYCFVLSIMFLSDACKIVKSKRWADILQHHFLTLKRNCARAQIQILSVAWSSLL